MSVWQKRRNGCDDYLAKPIDRRELLAMVACHASKPAPQTSVGH